MKKRVLILIVVALVLFGTGSFAFDRWMLGKTYERFPAPAASILPTYEDYGNAYPREDVEFTLDGYTLRGHVYGPDNTRGLIVFRHGIFSQHQDYLSLITAFVDKGWRVFAYDAIGCGESDGESTLGMSQSPRDVVAAVDYARTSGMAAGLDIALVGHSWGGYGVAAALAKAHGVSACVSMSGYDTPMKIISYSAQDAIGPLALTQVPTMWLCTVLDFGVDADVSASSAIRNEDVPTLVIHGTGDNTVPFDEVSIADALLDSVEGLPETITVAKRTDDGRNGHSTYFYAPASQAYFDECAQRLQELIEANDGNETAPDVQEYRDSVNIVKANTADPVLIGEIDDFLGTHLKSAS